MVNISIKSQPNRAFFLLFSLFLAFWFRWQTIKEHRKRGNIRPLPFYKMEKVLTGILNNPFKWRANRAKVGKMLFISAILQCLCLPLHMVLVLDSGGPDKT